jgi:hypothetical protein
MTVELPEACAPITSVELDYGDPAMRRHDRTPARLQIIPRATRDRFDRYSEYERPSPARYTVSRPRVARWSVATTFGGRVQM